MKEFHRAGSILVREEESIGVGSILVLVVVLSLSLYVLIHLYTGRQMHGFFRLSMRAHKRTRSMFSTNNSSVPPCARLVVPMVVAVVAPQQ